MKNKKKICFVLTQPDSAKSFFMPHIEKLSNFFDVYLVSNIVNDSDVLELPLCGYKSIPLLKNISLLNDIVNTVRLFKYLKKEKFDVVISMTAKASLTSAIASFFARIPHRIRIFTGQIWCNKTGLKRMLFKSIDKITVALDTEFLTDGQSQMDYLENEGVIRKGQYKVLANGSICGVDTKACVIDYDIRDQIRKKLNIENKVVFEFLGRLKREKGIHELLEAFDKLVLICPNAVLLLVGNDQENCIDTIHQYKNLSLDKNVIYYGFTKEPLKLTMVADVFCHPSYREGFPNSPLEASGMGLPLICSDIYGMRDTMVDNVTGLRCKVKDAESLYQCMLKLYKDESLRMFLGKNGQKRIRDLYPRELVTDAWLKYFKELLQ